MFTAPMNMYLSDRDRPKGAMKPMPNLMETELESFGAVKVEDFTWKQLFDTDACTICGRCTSVCPAHATGKPLDPREIVLKVGEVMAATGDPVVSPPVGIDREIMIGADSMFERITAEELWACTSCKACDEICPVNIEILDKILDMRRYLTLMESDFPAELGNTFRSMENSGNAYGMNQGDRADWAASLEGVAIIETGSPFGHEYLFFVGCAGSFDDRNKKTSRAIAMLLQRAGIDFAIVGPSEMCNGDQARRAGNEYIFQMLAMQNVETFNGMGVRKVITQCPHCFNVIKNEYPQLGGRLRGSSPRPTARLTAERRPVVACGCNSRRARHVSRFVLSRPSQRRVPRAPARGRVTRGHRPRRDATQRDQRLVLRCRRSSHVDGGTHRQEDQRRAQPGSDRYRRVAHRSRVPVLLRDARRRSQGRKQGRRSPSAGHRGDSLGSDRELECSARSQRQLGVVRCDVGDSAGGRTADGGVVAVMVVAV
jgi:heterodisulfide reductase subunit C